MLRRLLLAPLLVASCDGSDATYAAVNNLGEATVYKAWYRTTLIADPVPPGEESAAHLVPPGADVAYVLLAPGWSPDAAAPPALTLALTPRVTAEKGTTARIDVAPASLRTACSPDPLRPDEYATLRERIFPGDALPSYADACGARDAGAD